MQPGQYVLNRFRLERILGRGGMAVVWLGFDHFLDEWVALKFLPEIVVRDSHSLTILAREVKEARRLTHPNIIRIHDLLLEENIAAISMNWVDGSTLSDLRSGREEPFLEPEEVESYLPQILSALDYAHNEAKIVHRDLKPANIMVDKEGRIVITDFAIARSITDTTTRLTNRDNSGTLVYMSPQQIMGKNHHSNDYYSLGATLYDLFSGMPPFWTGNVTEQILKTVPPPITDRRRELGYSGKPIPPPWEAVIAACLNKDQEQRPASPEAFKDLLGGKPPLGATTEKPKPQAPPMAPMPKESDRLSQEGTALETPVPWDEKKSREKRGGKKRSSPGGREKAKPGAGSSSGDEKERQAPRKRVLQKPIHRPVFPETNPGAEPAAPPKKGTPPGPVEERPSLQPEPEDRFPWLHVGTAFALVVILLALVFISRTVQNSGESPSRPELDTVSAQSSAELLARLKEAELSIAEGSFSDAEEFLEPALQNPETRYRARQLLDSIESERYRVQDLFQRAESLRLQRRYAEFSSLVEELRKSPYARKEQAFELGKLDAFLTSANRDAATGGINRREDVLVPMAEGGPLELVWIAPGTFEMGSREESGRESDERSFTANLTRGFWIGRYEITQAQYQAIMGKNPSHFIALGGEAPVEQVDWFDAMEFCGRLTEREREAGRLPEGSFFTLPTEAQWEYACRAGTSTPFAFGEQLDATQANFNGNFPYGGAPQGEFRQSTMEVGSFQPNGFGLYDMHGNVREWCRSWYGPYPPGIRDDPVGPLMGEERAVRGGSWFNSARFCRSAERSSNEPHYQGDLLGFRIVLTQGSR